MGYTPPDLSEVLTNEQTMNSRLTTCRSELRIILTNEEIGYTSGDAIIPLIRKLPVPVLNSINVNMDTKFSTGGNLSAVVTAKDNKGNPMPNASIAVYRLDPNVYDAPDTVLLGTVTTGSDGKATVSVPMPTNKGHFYVQARNGNIFGGDYGVYCTTAVNGVDWTYSSVGSNLFSAGGVGSNSEFSAMEVETDDGPYADVVLEAHNGYSGNYFGIKLPELGSYTKSQLADHTFYAILADKYNSTKTYLISFGLAFNIDTWASLGIAAGGKYWYGDGTGSAGYRQIFENVQYMSSEDNGTPETAKKKLYMTKCNWGISPTVIDEYVDDPTVQYPEEFVRHGRWNCSLDSLPSGTGYPSIIFNMPDRYSYRSFRFYGAGVI